VQKLAFRVSFALQLVATVVNLAVALSGLVFRSATSLTLVGVSVVIAIAAGVVASLGGLRVWPALVTAVGGPVLLMGVFQLTFSLDGNPLECGGRGGPFTRATTFLPMADWCVGRDGGFSLAGGQEELVGETLGGLVLLVVIVSGCVAALLPRPHLGPRPQDVGPTRTL